MTLWLFLPLWRDSLARESNKNQMRPRISRCRCRSPRSRNLSRESQTTLLPPQPALFGVKRFDVETSLGANLFSRSARLFSRSKRLTPKFAGTGDLPRCERFRVFCDGLEDEGGGPGDPQ